MNQMSKERLEEIKREYKKDVYDCKLGRFEIDWLIEQAERVQELEKARKTLSDNHFQQIEQHKYLLEQNKRYREAIENIEKGYKRILTEQSTRLLTEQYTRVSNLKFIHDEIKVIGE